MTRITKLLCPTCGEYFIAEPGTKAGMICLHCLARWHTAHPRVLQQSKKRNGPKKEADTREIRNQFTKGIQSWLKTQHD